jgi:hypothetical protein
MHGLARSEWPAKVLLHHVAVFQNLPAVDRDHPVAVTGAAPCPARCSQRVGATEHASPPAPLIVHTAKTVTFREAPAFGDLTRNALMFACHNSRRTRITVGATARSETAKPLALTSWQHPSTWQMSPFAGLLIRSAGPSCPVVDQHW